MKSSLSKNWVEEKSKMKRIHYNVMQHLTLRPPIMTIVPYANSLNPDETPSNTQTTFSARLGKIKVL